MTAFEEETVATDARRSWPACDQLVGLENGVLERLREEKLIDLSRQMLRSAGKLDLVR